MPKAGEGPIIHGPKVWQKHAEDLAIKDQLVYFKSRVDEFENERATLLDSIEKCSVQAAELHRLDWENRRRADEIRELQKALSDAHAFLFEERQRLLALQAENDELRLQEIEDRKRIQQLLDYDPVVAARSGAATQTKSLDTLMLSIESLRAQLSEQKQLASERITALLEDRRIRDEEEQAHRSQMNQNLEQTAQKLKRMEELLRQSTKDAILARRDKQQAEERALAAATELALEKQQLHEEITVIKANAAEEVRELKQQSESKLEDITSNLRKQLKLRETELVNLTSTHTSTKAQLEKRVADLEAKSGKLVEQNKALELRRHMDMEGFAADVTNLRKMLASIDRKLHEMRLIERLGEDDRLDTILSHLRQKAPSIAPPAWDQADVRPDNSRHGDAAEAGSHSSYSAKSELAKGLKAIKGRIHGLEERLASKKAALAAGVKAGATPAGRVAGTRAPVP